jgi:hypothetical protein
MRQLSAGLCTLAILLCISSMPVQAQAAADAKAAAPFRHDASQEVSLTGTVSSVLRHAAPGTLVGAHLLLATLQGPVDASLGRFGLVGFGAVSVAAGQQIEVTGTIRTIKDKPVFIVRSLKSGSDVYTLRNEHGVLLPPHARERAALATSQKGESR